MGLLECSCEKQQKEAKGLIDIYIYFFFFLFSRSFLAEVSLSLDSEAISSLIEVAAVLHVLSVIKHSEFGIKILVVLKAHEDV